MIKATMIINDNGMVEFKTDKASDLYLIKQKWEEEKEKGFVEGRQSAVRQILKNVGDLV